MARLSESSPIWWDHEFDQDGYPIRIDVRLGVNEIWTKACRFARSLLGDDSDSAVIMETATARVSRYLNRKQVPVGCGNIPPLLMRAFSWLVRTRLALELRVEAVADLDKVAGRVTAVDWTQAVHRRLDLAKVLCRLTPRSRRIFVLRCANRSWKDIARELRMPASTVKNSFWREITRIRSEFKL